LTDICDAAELLGTARQALLGEVLPALSGEQRYTALMVANAMAIAAREAALGDEADMREVERLRGFASDIAPPSEPASADLPALRRAVSAAIRAGRFDDAAHATALVAALAHVAADRVAISNPRALRE
jgi:Domain of unknown function (DUF6285)